MYNTRNIYFGLRLTAEYNAYKGIYKRVYRCMLYVREVLRKDTMITV